MEKYKLMILPLLALGLLGLAVASGHLAVEKQAQMAQTERSVSDVDW